MKRLTITTVSTDYKSQALHARRTVLEMVHKAGTSHIASNFSVIDIATVLYANLGKDDQVVWSKGWAAATIYYFLAQEGKIPQEDLTKFPHPPYLGLAEPGVNGVLVAGGSMGHGLPVAVGMALGKKRSGEPGTIYCIMSDGEMNEGTTWESAMVAAHHKLDNLVVIVDKNGWQAMGKTDEVVDLDIESAFLGFHWQVRETDGHNHEKLEATILSTHTGPLSIVANTIKGKGVSFMENHLLYHYKHISDEDYDKALKELV